MLRPETTYFRSQNFDVKMYFKKFRFFLLSNCCASEGPKSECVILLD